MKQGVYVFLLRFNLSYCQKCGLILPSFNFRKESRRVHGLAYYCAKCRDIYARTGSYPEPLRPLYERIKRRSQWISDVQWVLSSSGLAYCTKGDHIRPREEFPACSANRHGLHNHCSECRRAYTVPQWQRILAARRHGQNSVSSA